MLGQFARMGSIGRSNASAAIRALFASGEPGAWYDPSDMSTLFQDSAGTVPVTAVEQPVGLILDKSGLGNHATQATTTKRPVLSARYGLIAGTEMTGGAGGAPGTAPDQWQLHIMNGTYAHTTESGKHRFTSSGGRSTVRAPMTWLPGVTYAINLDLINNSSASSVPSVMYIGLQSGTGVSLAYYVDGVMSSTIPPGMHTIKIVCSFTGGTAYPYLYIGAGAGSPDTADITALKCSVTLATDAHLPYQYVNTASDYDADPAKFPAYLRFDGVDDVLQTGNINFTGTDKMTVWAGMNSFTQQNGSALGTVVLHPDTGMNSFAVYAPAGANNLSFTTITSSATVAAASVSTIATNSNAVVAGIADLATRTATLRANGVQLATGTAASGGGNYRNGPLYIGGQAMPNRHFNGRLYSLIVRGAQSTLSQIEAAELYMKKKVGIA